MLGAGEREYQWFGKQSPAVRRTLVNVRGVIAAKELLLRDLFSSNQNDSFSIVPASNVRHNSHLRGVFSCRGASGVAVRLHATCDGNNGLQPPAFTSQPVNENACTWMKLTDTHHDFCCPVCHWRVSHFAFVLLGSCGKPPKGQSSLNAYT